MRSGYVAFQISHRSLSSNERYNDEQLMPSLDFMFKVRNLLHVLADAPHDDLTYHPEKEDLLQAQIARVLELTDETDEGRYAFMGRILCEGKIPTFQGGVVNQENAGERDSDFGCACGEDRPALLHR